MESGVRARNWLWLDRLCETGQCERQRNGRSVGIKQSYVKMLCTVVSRDASSGMMECL